MLLTFCIIFDVSNVLSIICRTLLRLAKLHPETDPLGDCLLARRQNGSYPQKRLKTFELTFVFYWISFPQWISPASLFGQLLE